MLREEYRDKKNSISNQDKRKKEKGMLRQAQQPRKNEKEASIRIDMKGKNKYSLRRRRKIFVAMGVAHGISKL